jgi:hypothetical protein
MTGIFLLEILPAQGYQETSNLSCWEELAIVGALIGVQGKWACPDC